MNSAPPLRGLAEVPSRAPADLKSTFKTTYFNYFSCRGGARGAPRYIFLPLRPVDALQIAPLVAGEQPVPPVGRHKRAVESARAQVSAPPRVGVLQAIHHHRRALQLPHYMVSGAQHLTGRVGCHRMCLCLCPAPPACRLFQRHQLKPPAHLSILFHSSKL